MRVLSLCNTAKEIGSSNCPMLGINLAGRMLMGQPVSDRVMVDDDTSAETGFTHTMAMSAMFESRRTDARNAEYWTKTGMRIF